MAQKRIVSRSAITGRFVKKSYAKAHPKTTINQRINKSNRKRGNHN